MKKEKSASVRPRGGRRGGRRPAGMASQRRATGRKRLQKVEIKEDDQEQELGEDNVDEPQVKVNDEVNPDEVVAGEENQDGYSGNADVDERMLSNEESVNSNFEDEVSQKLESVE